MTPFLQIKQEPRNCSAKAGAKDKRKEHHFLEESTAKTDDTEIKTCLGFEQFLTIITPIYQDLSFKIVKTSTFCWMNCSISPPSLFSSSVIGRPRQLALAPQGARSFPLIYSFWFQGCKTKQILAKFCHWSWNKSNTNEFLEEMKWGTQSHFVVVHGNFGKPDALAHSTNRPPDFAGSANLQGRNKVVRKAAPKSPRLGRKCLPKLVCA